jgi:RimJ/RimL family protein N-acetyltransferase
MTPPPTSREVWKTVGGYKFTTGDKFSAEQQLAWQNEGFKDYFVEWSFDPFSFEAILNCQYQHVSVLSLYMHDDKDEFVGFGRTAIRGQRAWVAGFAISPAFRGKGVGALLLKEYLQLLKDKSNIITIQLECIMANTRAFKLYQKFGFSTNFDLWNYVVEDIQSLQSPKATSLTVQTSDQLDLSLPWLQHRTTYSWQREFSALINSPRKVRQFKVLDAEGKLLVAFAVEISKIPARILGFAFESGRLSSSALSEALWVSLEGQVKGIEVAFEPEKSELNPILEAVEGCVRDTSLEEHNMILTLAREDGD